MAGHHRHLSPPWNVHVIPEQSRAVGGPSAPFSTVCPPGDIIFFFYSSSSILLLPRLSILFCRSISNYPIHNINQGINQSINQSCRSERRSLSTLVTRSRKFMSPFAQQLSPEIVSIRVLILDSQSAGLWYLAGQAW